MKRASCVESNMGFLKDFGENGGLIFMRYLIACAISFLWFWTLAVADAQYGLTLSHDAVIISTAIIAAGVMAGKED